MSRQNHSISAPHVLGITGGIGSGKSVVSRLMETADFPVYNCDHEAKRLNQTDPVIRDALKALAGEHVYTDEGMLDKKVLADYLFADPTHVSEVNAIVHPRVKADFLCWKERQTTAWVGIESAILYEAGLEAMVDKVLMVYAPEKVRIERAVERDHTSIEAVKERIACQMDDEKKREKADFVLVNDNQCPLIPAFFDILAILLCEFQD